MTGLVENIMKVGGPNNGKLHLIHRDMCDSRSKTRGKRGKGGREEGSSEGPKRWGVILFNKGGRLRWHLDG